MKIHEYQGKELLRQFGVPVPRGYPAFTMQESVEAAQKLGKGILAASGLPIISADTMAEAAQRVVAAVQ